MNHSINLKKLILEAQKTELFENDEVTLVRSKLLDGDVELANQFREFCRNDYPSRTANIRSGKQVAANPNNIDDVKPYFEMNNIFADFCQSTSEYGYQAYLKSGKSAKNSELKAEMTKTYENNPVEGESWFWYIAGIAFFTASIVGYVTFRKYIKRGVKWGWSKSFGKLFKEKLSNQLNPATVRNIPEEQLFTWVEQQQKAALAGSKQKMPKWAYDDLVEAMAETGVKAEVRDMVMNVCLVKIKNGTMSAKTFIEKLPKHLKTPANISRINKFAAESSKAAKDKAAMNAPRRRPIGF